MRPPRRDASVGRVARLDPDVTYAQVANRSACTACDAHGHPRIWVRMSIADFYRDCKAKGIAVPDR